MSGRESAAHRPPRLNLSEVAQWLRHAVAVRPRDATLHSNYGNALLALGRADQALASYERALALRPDLAEGHNNRGNALHALHRWHEALESFAQAIALRPSYPEAHYNRGNAFLDLQRYDEALASYEQALAIRPDYPQAHNNRGNALLSLGRYAEALASYERALRLEPRFAQAHDHRGHALRGLKRPREALASYEQALLIKPDYPQAWAHRGSVLNELERYADALLSCERALAVQPGYAAAHHHRGNALRGLHRPEEAVASYERALALKGDDAEAHRDLGNALRDLGRFEEALASYGRALAIDADFAEAHHNRGIVLHEMLRLPEALEAYDRALAIRPDCAEAHYHRAMARLLSGAFEEGWAEHEWRWKVERIRRPFEQHGFSQSPWLGAESLTGKTILLYGEQGLGDMIQFCRYVPLVAQLGGRVVLEVPRSLARLLSALPGVAQLRVWEEVRQSAPEGLAAFDYHCPLLSLPLAFKTTLGTAPAAVPYLSSPPDRLQYWQGKLGERRKPRVGLVWSGGLRPSQPEFWSLNRRNIPLAKLAPLKHADIEFYSLQRGQPAESELATLRSQSWDGPTLIDYTSELQDFAETAALIEQLDLVISVDTSTAHLAGALGKPVWILNRFDTCWRWLLDRTDSPWYPTARLYRQVRPGDWDEVVARVKADLDRLLEQIAASPTVSPGASPAAGHTVSVTVTAALQPAAQQAATHNDRGVRLLALGRLQQALGSFEQALAVSPDHPEALYNHGTVLGRLGRLEPALQSLERVAALRPGLAEAHNNRGNVLRELGRPAEALEAFERALAIRPDYPQAHYNRGKALRDLYRLEEAAESYARALALQPTFAEAYDSRGNVLQDLDRFEEALACHERALQLKPENADTHNNRGVTLHSLMRLQEALQSYERALQIRPRHAMARLNRSLVLLTLGDFRHGWTEHEWRRLDDTRRLKDRRSFVQPLWLGGERLAGRTILLCADHGLGDMIQFCRYVPLVAHLGAHVILEVPEPLTRLARSLEGVSRLVTAGQALPAFDFYCPLLSLPLAFQTRLDSIPARIPYLCAGAEHGRYWQRRLGERARRRVGLVWSGGFRPNQRDLWAVNRRRNVPLEKLAPLRHPDIEFYSLQKGQPAESELATLRSQSWDGPTLIDYTSELQDFADTAALIEQLDLVISVDTSTAHLAGALGKPVWILNRFDTCWRWLLDRTDSPWYPTVRLYRQQRPGDWESVVRRVRADLERLVGDGS